MPRRARGAVARQLAVIALRAAPASWRQGGGLLLLLLQGLSQFRDGGLRRLLLLHGRIDCLLRLRGLGLDLAACSRKLARECRGTRLCLFECAALLLGAVVIACAALASCVRAAVFFCSCCRDCRSSAMAVSAACFCCVAASTAFCDCAAWVSISRRVPACAALASCVRVQQAGAFVRPLFTEIGKVIVGQSYLVDRLLIGLLANGHVLLEGVPGLAKTLSVKSLASCLNVKFSRLQFTPDLLPADVIGTQIYNPQAGGVHHAQGPDLRQPHPGRRNQPRARQSAERAAGSHAGAAGHHRRPDLQLEEPFLVLATQNPIEQEGTYPLPEAQVDRFMLKLKIGYPTRDEERQILDLMARTTGTARRHAGRRAEADPRGAPGHQRHLRRRQGEGLHRGPGLRHARPGDYKIAGQGVHPARRLAARDHLPDPGRQGLCLPQGRGYVTPQDVKSIGMDVLRHRVTITYEAEAEEKTSETIIQKIFDELPVP